MTNVLITTYIPVNGSGGAATDVNIVSAGPTGAPTLTISTNYLPIGL